MSKEYKETGDGIYLARRGSDYGGYWIPTRLDCKVVYDCGVGEDTSFAHDIYYYFPEAKIHLFDPTSKAIKHMESLRSLPRMFFHYVGISDYNGPRNFFPPKDPNHASYSAENIQNTSCPHMYPCYTIKTIMEILNHKELSILKLDIEGSEYGVIKSLAQDNIRPKVLVVEFHKVSNSANLVNYVARWLNLNYVLLNQEGDNYTYLERSEYDRYLSSHKESE